MLVYPDPADGPDADAYPEGPALPGDGVLWESLTTIPGDPTTPFTPSLPHVYRLGSGHGHGYGVGGGVTGLSCVRSE